MTVYITGPKCTRRSRQRILCTESTSCTNSTIRFNGWIERIRDGRTYLSAQGQQGVWWKSCRRQVERPSAAEVFGTRFTTGWSPPPLEWDQWRYFITSIWINSDDNGRKGVWIANELARHMLYPCNRKWIMLLFYSASLKRLVLTPRWVVQKNETIWFLQVDPHE